MASTNLIFQPYKSLGFVSNEIPFVLRYINLKKQHLIITCVGRAFHLYEASHLRLINVSPIHEDSITCLAGDNHLIYSACKNTIYAWRRGHQLRHTFKGHSAPVELLLPFGPHLISIDRNNFLKIWNVKSEEIYSELTFDKDNFKITTIVHPSTYINKVLLGSEQGTMQLWNIYKSKLIYTFKGWQCHITVLEQSTALDVVAVGLMNGKIIFHNLKFDQTLFEFTQDWGAVTSLAFHSRDPIFVSGSPLGHLVFWDLEKRKIHSLLLNGHKSSITGAQFLPTDPLLITSSPDNSLKMWIMDMVDGSARLLKQREGHSSPPKYIRFYSENGNDLLSAGDDSSIRLFSTVSETLNRNLGVASYNRKKLKKKKSIEKDSLIMPPIVSFDFERTREKDWDNIAVIHQNYSNVTTWSYDKCRMGDHKLNPKHLKSLKNKIYATCACITKCGNFVLVGYNLGQVERFNIQSGIHRFSYGNPYAHTGVVNGLQVDNLNRIVISGGNDKCIKFWHFKKTNPQLSSIIKLEETITFFRIHHESSILVIALDDYSIFLIDLDTRNIFRKFEGHDSQITDLTFSPDSKWLISASMDSTIRVWDIPTAQLIDYFETESPCLSLTFSNTGEYLATAHVNHLGIFIWHNTTLYSHVSLKALENVNDENIVRYNLHEFNQEIVKDTKRLDSIENNYVSLDQINDQLISLSLLPTSRWQHLLNFDLIKKRNKPKETIIKSKEAPFFLPTLPSLDLKFDFSNLNSNDEYSKISNNSESINLTAFGKMLEKSRNTSKKNFLPLIDILKNLSPSSLEFEITSFSQENGGSIFILKEFIHLLEFMFNSNQNFELAQSYLSLFLKIHTNLLIKNKELVDILEKLNDIQLEGWKRIEKNLHYNSCVLQTLRLIS